MLPVADVIAEGLISLQSVPMHVSAESCLTSVAAEGHCGVGGNVVSQERSMNATTVAGT